MVRRDRERRHVGWKIQLGRHIEGQMVPLNGAVVQPRMKAVLVTVVRLVEVVVWVDVTVSVLRILMALAMRLASSWKPMRCSWCSASPPIGGRRLRPIDACRAAGEEFRPLRPKLGWWW